MKIPENLWKFAKDTAVPFEKLPKYLIRLLEEANKPKPDPKIWKKSEIKYDSEKHEWLCKVNDKFVSIKDCYHSLVNLGLFDELYHPSTYKTGMYKCLGWVFNFSKSWERYLVHFRHGNWEEMRAPNKTYIRIHSIRKSDIIEIVKLPKKRKENE